MCRLLEQVPLGARSILDGPVHHVLRDRYSCAAFAAQRAVLGEADDLVSEAGFVVALGMITALVCPTGLSPLDRGTWGGLGEIDRPPEFERQRDLSMPFGIRSRRR